MKFRIKPLIIQEFGRSSSPKSYLSKAFNEIPEFFRPAHLSICNGFAEIIRFLEQHDCRPNCGNTHILLLSETSQFRAGFQRYFSSVEIDFDFDLLFLGCCPTRFGKIYRKNVCEVKGVSDVCAVLIASCAVEPVLRRLRLSCREREKPTLTGLIENVLDNRKRNLCVVPNIFWLNSSATRGAKEVPIYSQEGTPSSFTELYLRQIEKCLLGRSYDAKPIKIALLFLTISDINHPEIWEDWISKRPGSVEVFCHAKYRNQIRTVMIRRNLIRKSFATEWGHISLVHATRALLKEALRDQEITHFILLSESCVPIKPLSELIKFLNFIRFSVFPYSDIDTGPIGKVQQALSKPIVPKSAWTFHPQWWIFNRLIAFCSSETDYTSLFDSMISDEVYFGTVTRLENLPLGDLVLRQLSHWSLWPTNVGRPMNLRCVTKYDCALMVKSGAFFARKFPKGSNIGKFGLHKTDEL